MRDGAAPGTERIRIVRLPEVCRMTGLGKTKIYDLIAEESFPLGVKITSHAVGWVESEVQMWLARRIEANRCHSHSS